MEDEEPGRDGEDCPPPGLCVGLPKPELRRGRESDCEEGALRPPPRDPEPCGTCGISGRGYGLSAVAPRRRGAGVKSFGVRRVIGFFNSFSIANK